MIAGVRLDPSLGHVRPLVVVGGITADSVDEKINRHGS
jgi:hypothetical protein